MKRHLFISWFFLVVLALSLIASAAQAGSYPDRPIELIIPYPPGAASDVGARILAEELEKILGTKIVLLNKPGASSILGTEAAVRAPKDGYTLVYSGAQTLIYSPIANPEIMRFDPFKDMELLGFHYFVPVTFAVRSDAPWKTFPDLVDYAKKNPGKLGVATFGVGSSSHFLLQMVMDITGAQFTHVPFAGGQATVAALLGGHVEVDIDPIVKLKPQIDAGKIRILLIDNKMPNFPEIPTITELGYKQSLITSWTGLYSPSGIPAEVREILVPAVEKAVRLTKPRLDKMGGLVEYKSLAELQKMTERDYKTALEIAKRIGIGLGKKK